MSKEIEKICYECQKNKLSVKCCACIVSFKKIELNLKKRQEILENS